MKRCTKGDMHREKVSLTHKKVLDFGQQEAEWILAWSFE